MALGHAFIEKSRLSLEKLKACFGKTDFNRLLHVAGRRPDKLIPFFAVPTRPSKVYAQSWEEKKKQQPSEQQLLQICGRAAGGSAQNSIKIPTC